MAEARLIDNEILGNVKFGNILSDLIAIDTVTDIELRYGEVWVVDIRKGRYKYDLSQRTKGDKDELNQLLDNSYK